MTCTLRYASNARRCPAHVEAVLVAIGDTVGLAELLLTSTLRTVEDQARIMVDMVRSRGAEYARDLYGSAGDAVVDVIAAELHTTGGDPDGAAREEVRRQIERGGVVSRHLPNADYYAVDVSPRTLDAAGAGKQAAFIAAARAHPSVRKVIPPPGDPAVHVEIALREASPVLVQGAEGDAVRELQRLLVAAGAPVKVDGDFGPRTTAAVRAFQRTRGLVADGEVGPLTWAALRAG